MSIHDDLSRLAEGDVDPDERARLLERLETDPEAQAVWARLQSLPRQFDALLATRPPPGLDERVLGATSRRWRFRAAIPWALAAAVALIAVGWPREPVVVTVLAGTQEVAGRAQVVADDVVVDVDGRVRVSREPGVRSARGTGLGGEAMKLGRPGAAVIGAVVTVVVLEGTAVVRAGAAPSVLHAGETTTIGHPSASAPTRPAPDPDPPSKIADLEAENGLLRSMLQQTETEWHGTPIPWPDDLPEALTPTGFQRTVQAAIEKCAPDLQIVGFECSEPPCFVELRTPKREWWDDLVNNCPTWTEAYTSSVAMANGQATCPDGHAEPYTVLGWSASLAEPPGGFTPEEEENQNKRFEARIDEIKKSWSCSPQ